MARMIPPSIDPEIKSNAEVTVFNWFVNLNRNNYRVIHSLGIASHRNNIFGEIDFVVICREGILCIEVKGGKVERSEGIWYHTNRFGLVTSKHKGPFDQAQGNMHSLKDFFRKRLTSADPIARCQFASSVMMPECVFSDMGPDVIEDVLFDQRMTQSDFDGFIIKSFEYWRRQCLEKHAFEGGRLSDDDIDRAVTLLRSNFQFIPSLSCEISRIDDVLLSLTDEQYQIIENLEDNPRLLIHGPAGTGKTILAAEQCKCEAAKGNRVLYVCFNKLISQFVKHNVEKYAALITVSTISSLLMKYGGTSPIETDEERFFKETLPESFIDKLPDQGWPESEIFDILIIDEGQDIISNLYLICIDTLIKGGLKSGTWTIYYDPNQNIFNKSEDFDQSLKQLKSHGVSYGLSVNCRNTKQIGQGNVLLTNIGMAKTMRVSGQEIHYEKYSDINHERRLLNETLRNLKAQGLSLSDIAILSPYRPDNPLACLSTGNLSSDIGQLKINPSIDLIINNNNHVKYYTIQAFKGLEAKVVILIDIDNFEDDSRRLLNYVGISRARTLLYIFYKANMEASRQKMLIQGLPLLKFG